MGGLGSMLGLGGGFAGSGVSGPAQAQIINPVDAGQTATAYTNANDAIAKQQAFANAVNAQNGLGNQSSVFNQLQGVANGTGPNPAAAQLAQSTGQNVANQAALMAGQRGSSANVGLLARQGAQVGGNLQQQAAGQGATMQANQSLNALNSQGSLATSQANQQASAVSGLAQSTQGEQANLLNSIQGVNNASVASQTSVNNANAGIIQNSMKSQAGLLSGAGQALALAQGGVVPGPQKLADGGAVSPSAPQPKSSYAKVIAGALDNSVNSSAPQDTSFQSGQQMGKAIGTLAKKGYGAISDPGTSQGQGLQQDPLGVGSLDPNAIAPSAAASSSLGGADMASQLGSMAEIGLAKGGPVKAMVSPGEQYLKPNEVKEVVTKGKNPLEEGERIPGKPKVKGNSYANDVVPKTLESGGIVIPNSVMQSKDPAANAAKFVAAHCKAQAFKQGKK